MEKIRDEVIKKACGYFSNRAVDFLFDNENISETEFKLMFTDPNAIDKIANALKDQLQKDRRHFVEIKDNPVKIFTGNEVIDARVSDIEKGHKFSFVNDPDDVFIAKADAFISDDTWGVIV